ncbi:MAG: hypothetical protein R3F11_03110 [Verrucomicrobiales bacterium]
MINKTVAVSVLTLATFSSVSHGTLWEYSWAPPDPLFGNNDGGIWRSVYASHDDQTNILSFSATLDTSVNDTQALWLSITNGVLPDTVNGDWAAYYLAEGQLIVAPYLSSPVEDHVIDSTIMLGTYDEISAGNLKTFSFQVDAGSINAWSDDPSWKGTGFPFDAQGDTGGNEFTPYRMGIWARSFADRSVDLDSSTPSPTWDVTWGKPEDPNIGTFDDVKDFGRVPEPSGGAFALTLGVISVLRRRRKRSRDQAFVAGE